MNRAVETPPPLHRIPFRYVLAEVAAGVPLMLPFCALSVAALLTEISVPTTWLWLFIVGILLTNGARPAAQWSTVRYDVGREGVWVASGMVLRTTRFIAWNRVAAVEIERPVNLRLWGLATAVIVIGGDSAPRSTLPGIPLGMADRLRESAGKGPAGRGAADATSVEVDSVPGVPAGGDAISGDAVPVFTASAQDLALAAVLYGRAAVYGGAAAVGLFDFLGSVGLQDDASRLISDSPLVVGVTSALGILAWGIVATVTRYAHLTTELGKEAITIRHGLFSMRERTVPLRAVIGVELRRNVVEAALGRSRLSLITLDSSGRLGANLVLPSQRDSVVMTIVRGSFAAAVIGAGSWDAARDSWSIRSALRSLSIVLSVPILAVLAVRAWQPGARLSYSAAVFLVTSGLVFAVGRIISTRLEGDERCGAVSAHSRFVIDRTLVIRSSVLGGVRVVAFGDRILGVGVHYFSSRPRMIVASNVPKASVQGVLRLLHRPEKRGEPW